MSHSIGIVTVTRTSLLISMAISLLNSFDQWADSWYQVSKIH